MAFIEELKAAFSTKPSKAQKLADEPAAYLERDIAATIHKWPQHKKEELDRYLHIFNKDITPVKKRIEEMNLTGKADIKNYLKFMNDEDKMKWGDYVYMGKKPTT